jgi:hypothetical protein
VLLALIMVAAFIARRDFRAQAREAWLRAGQSGSLSVCRVSGAWRYLASAC